MIVSHDHLGHEIELEEMIALAHRFRSSSMPAAELPPADNLRKFVKMEADLVMVSGDKNLRGRSAAACCSAARI